MTALNKQALREEFRYMQDHYNDPADRKKQEIYIAAEALLDELETVEKRIAEQREYYEGVIADGSKRIAEMEDAQCQHESDTFMLCHQFDELASAMGWTSELAMKQGVGQLEYARSIKARIAELEAKLETADKLQDSAFRDGLKAGFSYGQTDDQSGFAQCMSAYSNAGIGVKHQEDSVDSDVSSRNQPGMVVAVHIDAGDFVKFKGQVFEVEETDFDDHDVTLWFVGGNTLKCAAGCQVEVVSAPVAAGIKVKGE
ncbi:ead/Ea22-like family protein [Salmonella enterica]|nr:ead/Ea22-like family protein [Salmonella enterica subsp. houtenae]EGO0676553.1 ead/Ea22-like family protein [Salmonella enterica]EGO0734016.1 ead/Ea22-like family protein [Salmonella enterica]EGO0814809.1 ead/Ea22-like family protein [Salmonella enterica]EGO0820848.1 ead/Ea22-like family protein [Salmonella enterica]